MTLDVIGMTIPEKNSSSTKEICSQHRILYHHVLFVCPPSAPCSFLLPSLSSRLLLLGADLFELRSFRKVGRACSLSPGGQGRQASWAPSLPFGFQEPYVFQPWPPLPGKCPGFSLPVDRFCILGRASFLIGSVSLTNERIGQVPRSLLKLLIH